MTLRNSFSKKNKKDTKPKNTFFNILREDRKRRIWPFVLFCLICFLMTAAFELNLESYLGREWTFQRIQTSIENLTRNGMITYYLIFAGLAACLYGFQGFGWLMKKEQVDFYHSQPMKREKRFVVIYLNGMIMYLLPMLVHVAVYTFLIGIRGYLNRVVLLNIVMNTVIALIAFWMMYHLVIMAVMLTGNLIVSFLMCSIVFVYPSVIKMLLNGFFDSYFETYVTDYANPIEWIGYLSPVERVYRAGNYMVRGELGQVAISLMILAVMAVVMLAAAYFLYKKRPSEAAGNALAYPFAGDFIRFLVVIPGGMFFGILFASVGVMSNIFWLYFGTIVGAFLTHGFMEVIFHFDIKAALGKKAQLAASAILVLCIVNIFCFDIFGYDSYLPKAEQVDEVSYFVNIGEYETNYRILDGNGIPVFSQDLTEVRVNKEMATVDSLSMYMPYENTTFIYRQEYQMKASVTKEVEPIIALIRAHMDYGYDDTPSGQTMQMIVHYKLKSGRDVYRRYIMNRDVVEEHYGPIYDTEAGKKVIYPYWNLSGVMAQNVSVYAPFMSETVLELTGEEIEELAACYRKDIEDQSLTELLNAQYIGETRLRYEQFGNSDNTMSLALYIADHHENMIGFFEARDIYLTLPNKNYEVTEITVYNPYGADDTVNHPFWKGREEVVLTQEQMEELMPSMIPDQYGYNGFDREFFLSGHMIVKNIATGKQQQVYCNVPSVMTPQYMRIEE